MCIRGSPLLAAPTPGRHLYPEVGAVVVRLQLRRAVAHCPSAGTSLDTLPRALDCGQLGVGLQLHAADLLHGAVDGGELPAPPGVVEEGAVVEPVVIWTVHFRVVAGGQGGHLVPVY